MTLKVQRYQSLLLTLSSFTNFYRLCQGLGWLEVNRTICKPSAIEIIQIFDRKERETKGRKREVYIALYPHYMPDFYLF